MATHISIYMYIHTSLKKNISSDRERGKDWRGKERGRHTTLDRCVYRSPGKTKNIYIYIHIKIYMYMYIYIYTFPHICTRTHEYMYICICIYTYVSVHTHICIDMQRD